MDPGFCVKEQQVYVRDDVDVEEMDPGFCIKEQQVIVRDDINHLRNG